MGTEQKDELDRLLGELGTEARGRLDGKPLEAATPAEAVSGGWSPEAGKPAGSAPAGSHPTPSQPSPSLQAPAQDAGWEGDFEAYSAGRLSPQDKAAFELRLAQNPAMVRLLALRAREGRPLSEARTEAVLAVAQAQLAEAREEASVWGRLRAVARWWWEPRRLGVLVAATAALLVLWTRGPSGPGGAANLPAYQLELGGQISAWQGSDGPSETKSPEFTKDSSIELVLRPAVEGVPVALAAWALLPDGQVRRLTPDGPARVIPGAGGLLLQGKGEALLGTTPGLVRLLLALTPPGAEGDLPLDEARPARLSQELAQADAEGRIKLLSQDVRYR